MTNTLPPPGTTIATYALGPLYTHYGIVSEDGHVIHSSKRLKKVVQESLANFCDGNPWWVSNIKGQRSAGDVVAWARSQIGQRWDLLDANCEHFVRVAHGLKKQSVQVGATVAVALIWLFFGKK